MRAIVGGGLKPGQTFGIASGQAGVELNDGGALLPIVVGGVGRDEGRIGGVVIVG